MSDKKEFLIRGEFANAVQKGDGKEVGWFYIICEDPIDKDGSNSAYGRVFKKNGGQLFLERHPKLRDGRYIQIRQDCKADDIIDVDIYDKTGKIDKKFSCHHLPKNKGRFYYISFEPFEHEKGYIELGIGLHISWPKFFSWFEKMNNETINKRVIEGKRGKFLNFTNRSWIGIEFKRLYLLYFIIFIILAFSIIVTTNYYSTNYTNVSSGDLPQNIITLLLGIFNGYSEKLNLVSAWTNVSFTILYIFISVIALIFITKKFNPKHFNANSFDVCLFFSFFFALISSQYVLSIALLPGVPTGISLFQLDSEFAIILFSVSIAIILFLKNRMNLEKTKKLLFLGLGFLFLYFLSDLIFSLSTQVKSLQVHLCGITVFALIFLPYYVFYFTIKYNLLNKRV